MLQNRCFFRSCFLICCCLIFFLVWEQSILRFSVYNSCYLFEYSADIIMLQLLPAVTVHWAPRHGLSSKQSTTYAKFGKISLKKVFKKQKIIPWLTEHDDVINITSLPAPGGGISADCASTPLGLNPLYFQLFLIDYSRRTKVH